MLEKLYDELNEYLDFEIEKMDENEIKRKESELNVDFPESMCDFYLYYGNSEKIRTAFYLINDLDDVRIENSGLEFGYTTQAQAILGITLKHLKSEKQSISYHYQNDETWFSEGAIRAEGFFFNIVAWHIINLKHSVARVNMNEDKFMELCKDKFEFFSDQPKINLGYRIYSCRRNNVLGCYLVEEEQFYIGAKTDAELHKLEEELGWEEKTDWL